MHHVCGLGNDSLSVETAGWLWARPVAETSMYLPWFSDSGRETFTCCSWILSSLTAKDISLNLWQLWNGKCKGWEFRAKEQRNEKVEVFKETLMGLFRYFSRKLFQTLTEEFSKLSLCKLTFFLVQKSVDQTHLPFLLTAGNTVSRT